MGTSHPTGESKLKLAKREEMLLSCAGVQTMAGSAQVRWETESAATPMWQLAYFIEFLNLTGLWSRWLESRPLSYTSPNPRPRSKCWAPGCCRCSLAIAAILM